MVLSKEDVQHIAYLGRIGITEQDVEKYQRDLSAILDYAAMLQTLDTKDDELIGHITGIKNIMRADQAKKTEENDRQALLQKSPELKDDYIKVKSVL